MSAEVRLHSEGCRERIERTDVKNECASRKEPEQTISGVRSFGGMFSQLVRSPETEGGSSHTHEAHRDYTPRTRSERGAKKAKEEVVKNVTESMTSTSKC